MSKSEEFMLWFTANELSKSNNLFISEKLSLKFDEETGYGLSIEQSLVGNELLFRIPNCLLLNYLSCMKYLLCKDISQIDIASKCNADERFEIFEMTCFTKIEIPKSKSDDIQLQYSKFTPVDLLNLSSFQLVSMFLCLETKRGTNSFWYKFLQVLPKDFNCLPLTWAVKGKQDLLEALPISVYKKVLTQLQKFDEDYAKVKELLRNRSIEVQISKDDFLNQWLCINSRCLYYQLPSSILSDKTTNDNFTLCPLVDFINHCDDQNKSAKIQVNGFDSFDVLAPECGFLLENPQKNHELFFSYGAHPNSFLLTEYGFVLPYGYNKFETVDITDQVIEKLNEQQIIFLKENDYFEDYTLTEDYLSFRTTIALTLLSTQNQRKTLHLLNGLLDETQFQTKNNQVLSSILSDTLRQYNEKLLFIQNSQDCDLNIKTLLNNFYKFQMRICNNWIKKIKIQQEM